MTERLGKAATTWVRKTARKLNEIEAQRHALIEQVNELSKDARRVIGDKDVCDHLSMLSYCPTPYSDIAHRAMERLEQHYHTALPGMTQTKPVATKLPGM